MTRKPKRSSRTGAIKQASYGDIAKALSNHVDQILEQIDAPDVSLCMPTDGGRPRVIVSVPSGQGAQIPDNLIVMMGRRRIALPCEVHEDLETVLAQSDSTD